MARKKKDNEVEGQAPVEQIDELPPTESPQELRRVVNVKLHCTGIPAYGASNRMINGRRYELSLQRVTEVLLEDVEELKRREPFLIVLED